MEWKMLFPYISSCKPPKYDDFHRSVQYNNHHQRLASLNFSFKITKVLFTGNGEKAIMSAVLLFVLGSVLDMY